MQPGAAPQSKPMMTIQESVRTCIRKYAHFSGRATRAEYWWWVLATTLVGFAIGAVDGVINVVMNAAIGYGYSPLSTIFSLAILLPNLAVTARRLHDIGKSGWWQLAWWLIAGLGWIIFVIALAISLISIFSGADFDRGMEGFFRSVGFGDFVPAIIGLAIAIIVTLAVFIWVLVWMIRQGQTGPNRFGPDPRALDEGDGGQQPTV